jgi:dTDP-glucose 4,6-dehydratase
VSTDEVYGEAVKDNIGKHSEMNTLLQPTNPYSATKAGAEFLVQAYNKSFHLPTIITRGNNVYGPKQYPEKLIPKFICLLSKRKPCPIHGSGNHARNFIHVSDVVNAFDTILHKGIIGDIYNIGTKTEISNLNVAKELIKLFGLESKEEEFIKFVEDRPFNDFRYTIDFEKLSSLGWESKISWKEGLKNTSILH